VSTQVGTLGGRAVHRLAELLRVKILEGEVPEGQFMPSVREIAQDHGCGKVTVVRALKILEGDGLVVARNRRGYRVLCSAGEPEKGLPVAFIFTGDYTVGAGNDEEFANALLAEFQQVANLNQWSMLVLRSGNLSYEETAARLRATRACGAVVDSADAGLLTALSAVGVPAVVVDDWREGLAFDCVSQDGFAGSMQAVAHLLARGHRRIGWLGPDVRDGHPQIAERYGGAMSKLAEAGLSLSRDVLRVAPLGRPEAMLVQATKLLSGARRPDAVLALWQESSAAVLQAARQLDLDVRSDFDLVGWCTREQYQAGWCDAAGEGTAPAMVTWSVGEMARLAVARLLARRRWPRLPAAQLRVTTGLMTAEAGDGAAEDREDR